MILRLIQSSYNTVKNALTQTRSLLGERIHRLLGQPLNEEILEELEEAFYEADLGVKTSVDLVEKLQEQFKKNPSLKPEEAMAYIRQTLIDLLSQESHALHSPKEKTHPTVILVVGANGNGKTTSIAKLSHRFVQEGKKVMVAAGDTFRAAAVEQLEIWAKELGVDIVRGRSQGDPAAVAFDALTSAKAQGHDVCILDTAGRLHTKTGLMQELNKIKRSCQKVLPESPHETLLVLDTSIGQNAVDQAKVFHQHTPITGLILTKLDGTAKGGIVVAIQRELGIPIKFIGVGEGKEDLQPFDAEAFTAALFD